MATCILRVQDIPSNTIHLSGPVASPSVNSSYFSLSTSDDLDQMEHDFGLRHYIRESRPLPRKPGYPCWSSSHGTPFFGHVSDALV